MNDMCGIETRGYHDGGGPLIAPVGRCFAPQGPKHPSEGQRPGNTIQRDTVSPERAKIAIGNPEKYKQLNFDLLSGKGGQYGFNRGDQIALGHGSHIHPTARLKGPLMVGDNCTIGKDVIITGPTIIGPDCRIEAGATISDSILWQKVTIGGGCSFISSIAARGCRLEESSQAHGAVLGDNVTVSQGYVLKPGESVEPGVTKG